MGYFSAYQAVQFTVEKAKAFGIAGAVTCNHFHFGGAGKYSRIALAAEESSITGREVMLVSEPGGFNQTTIHQ